MTLNSNIASTVDAIAFQHILQRSHPDIRRRGVAGKRKMRDRREMRYAAVKPPSTTSSAPVVNDDSSLARNRIVRATSAGCASRPSGAAAL